MRRQTPVEPFEALRPRLFGIAYRMLGVVADAEDVVQDAFLQWRRAADAPRSTEAWLISVTTRLAIDRQRRAATERAAYEAQWLPEPVPLASPERDAELADDLSLALLLLLERLAAEERAALLLREAFGAEYAEIARTLGKTEAACRQIVHRAKNRVRHGRRRFAVDCAEHAAVVRCFVEALRAEDCAGVLALLTDDVHLVTDGGGRTPALREVQQGAAHVAQRVGFEHRERTKLGRHEAPPVEYDDASAADERIVLSHRWQPASRSLRDRARDGNAPHASTA